MVEITAEEQNKVKRMKRMEDNLRDPWDSIKHTNICCKAGLVVLNSSKFCFSEKLFILPSILNEILVGYSNLGCRFFPFSTLNISCHSLLACRVSAERSAVRLWGFPCMLLIPSPLLLLIFFICV